MAGVARRSLPRIKESKVEKWNDGYWLECCDRCHTMCTMIEALLSEHPAIVRMGKQKKIEETIDTFYKIMCGIPWGDEVRENPDTDGLHPLAIVIIEFMSDKTKWHGDHGELLWSLNLLDSFRKLFPLPLETPKKMIGDLRRLAPLLKQNGIVVNIKRQSHRNRTQIYIRKDGK